MRTWRFSMALLLVLSLLAAGCGGGEASGGEDGGGEQAGGSGGGELSGNLLGAGATFPEPLYLDWIGTYTQQVEPGVSINYQGIGSSGGREQFIAQEVDFAGSDVYMTDGEIRAAEKQRGGGEVLHIPMVFGGVVVAFNVPGLDELTLDAETIADIFLGEIDNINDPAIAELNPGVDLPDQPLTVAHRSDGSGTTSIFTTYLTDEDRDWAREVGEGDEVDWPTGVGGEGNDGVASAVSQQTGGIGYMGLEFAAETGLSYASVENADGNVVEPTSESVSAATEGLDLPPDLRFDILGVGGQGYPIAGATWVLAYTEGYPPSKAEPLVDYLTWALEEGDTSAEKLNYAPLPDSAEQLSLDQVEQISVGG